MGRIENKHQPVEKAPATGRAFGKQTLHIGCQPQRRQTLTQRDLTTRRSTIDPYRAPSGTARRTCFRRKAGANVKRAVAIIDRCGNRPGSWREIGRTGNFRRGAARDIDQSGTPKATARHKERNGFQQIGLAGAVGPGEYHRAVVEIKRQGLVTTKIGQPQPPDGDPAHLIGRAIFGRSNEPGGVKDKGVRRLQGSGP